MRIPPNKKKGVLNLFFLFVCIFDSVFLNPILKSFFFSIEKKKNERAFSVKKAKIQDKSEPLTINLIHE